MRKIFSISIILISGLSYAQNNYEDLKLENSNLKKEIQTVNSENDYLKKILEINQAISQIDKEGTSFKILDLIGDKTKKTISLMMLLESEDENKDISLQEISMIDMLGNEFKIKEYEQVVGLVAGKYTTLTLNVPKKIVPVFIDVENQPQLIKLLRVKFYSTKESEKNKFAKIPILEFKDLKVNWN